MTLNILSAIIVLSKNEEVFMKRKFLNFLLAIMLLFSVFGFGCGEKNPFSGEPKETVSLNLDNFEQYFEATCQVENSGTIWDEAGFYVSDSYTLIVNTEAKEKNIKFVNCSFTARIHLSGYYALIMKNGSSTRTMPLDTPYKDLEVQLGEFGKGEEKFVNNYSAGEVMDIKFVDVKMGSFIALKVSGTVEIY